MARFRLKVGKHVGKGGRVYNAGDIVESPVDLVTLLGVEKFERVDGKVSASRNAFPVTPGSVSAPQGQVHSGKQETGGVDGEGEPVSGPMEEDADPATEEALNPGENESGEGEEGSGEGEAVDFNTMSVAQLKEYAENNEIDIAGAKTKKDIIAKLTS